MVKCWMICQPKAQLFVSNSYHSAPPTERGQHFHVVGVAMGGRCGELFFKDGTGDIVKKTSPLQAEDTHSDFRSDLCPLWALKRVR